MKIQTPQNQRWYYYGLIIVTLGFIILGFWPALSIASPPPVTVAPASSSAPTSISPPKPSYQPAIDWLWNVVEGIGKNSTDKIVAAILAGAATLGGVSWRYARKKAHSVFFDFPSREKERGQLVLILGQTTSGKTTLVKQVFSYPARQPGAPDPRRPTDDVDIYTVLHETKTLTSTETYRYDLIDYRGSDPGQLAQEWDDVVKDLKFTEATAVILVVDIFAAGSDQREHEEMNEYELSNLIGYWGGALPTLAGSVGNRPNLVVLFINKLDLLKNVPARSIIYGEGKRIPAIAESLAPLVKIMKTTFNLEVEIIAGSLRYGIGVNDLLAKLRDLSPVYPRKQNG